MTLVKQKTINIYIVILFCCFKQCLRTFNQHLSPLSVTSWVSTLNWFIIVLSAQWLSSIDKHLSCNTIFLFWTMLTHIQPVLQPPQHRKLNINTDRTWIVFSLVASSVSNRLCFFLRFWMPVRSLPKSSLVTRIFFSLIHASSSSSSRKNSWSLLDSSSLAPRAVARSCNRDGKGEKGIVYRGLTNWWWCTTCLISE